MRAVQVIVAVLVCLIWASNGLAQQVKTDKELGRKKPEVTQNIGVDSKTGDVIPLELTFRDSEQRSVDLGAYFDGSKPVILSFNYSDCPKLCSVQLENMTRTLKEISGTFKVNEDFQLISISIDPNEQVTRARKTKQKYVELYDVEGSEDGFHFLTGKRKDIQKITDACGFRYRYITRQKYYSHPPVFILLSPDGKIVRYIHGLKYDPKTIELALIESAEGKIGSPINILSYGIGCFVFDESTGKYTFQAMALMRIGGIATVATLLLTLGPYWFLRTGSKDKPKQGMPSTDATT